MERLHKLTSAVSKRSLQLKRRVCGGATLLVLALLFPTAARAEYTASGGGGVTALESSDIGASLLGFFEAIVAFATGPIGIAAMTIILLACVLKAAANMQRQQSIAGPASAAGFCILFFLVPALVEWAGQTSGAVM